MSDGMFPSEGKAKVPRAVGHRLADEAAVEDLARRGDGVGLVFALPAQAVLDGEAAPGLPLVLDEERDALLRDVLGPRLLDAQPAHARLLQVEEDGAADAGARRALPVLRGGAVRALHVVRVARVVQEAVGGAEDVAAVGEPDEGLDALHPVVLDAGLEGVAALDQRDVVVELDALVVVVDGDEERHAEAVAAAEVEGGVGQGPALAGDVGAVVGPRPVLARELEAELVEDGRGQARDRASRCPRASSPSPPRWRWCPRSRRRRCRSAARTRCSCSAGSGGWSG